MRSISFTHPDTFDLSRNICWVLYIIELARTRLVSNPKDVMTFAFKWESSSLRFGSAFRSVVRWRWGSLLTIQITSSRSIHSSSLNSLVQGQLLGSLDSTNRSRCLLPTPSLWALLLLFLQQVELLWEWYRFSSRVVRVVNSLIQVDLWDILPLKLSFRTPIHIPLLDDKSRRSSLFLLPLSRVQPVSSLVSIPESILLSFAHLRRFAWSVMFLFSFAHFIIYIRKPRSSAHSVWVGSLSLCYPSLSSLSSDSSIISRKRFVQWVDREVPLRTRRLSANWLVSSRRFDGWQALLPSSVFSLLSCLISS